MLRSDPEISRIEVMVKRYRNSNRVPKVGDRVLDDFGDTHVVGRLGQVARYFCNCRFDGVFVLTNPEHLRFIGEVNG